MQHVMIISYSVNYISQGSLDQDNTILLLSKATGLFYSDSSTQYKTMNGFEKQLEWFHSTSFHYCILGLALTSDQDLANPLKQTDADAFDIV